MINSVMEIPCTDCDSAGLIFFGTTQDYDVEPCGCTKGDNYFFNDPTN